MQAKPGNKSHTACSEVHLIRAGLNWAAEIREPELWNDVALTGAAAALPTHRARVIAAIRATAAVLVGSSSGGVWRKGVGVARSFLASAKPQTLWRALTIENSSRIALSNDGGSNRASAIVFDNNGACGDYTLAVLLLRLDLAGSHNG
jgi:hypothetical protein